MHVITPTVLRELAESHDGLRVTIYLPTHRGGPEIQQDPLRLRALIGEAEERLLARDLRRPEAETLLAPARRLIHEGIFRIEPDEGLALFISRRGCHRFNLPLPVREQVVVGNRFYVKPLLPSLVSNGRFYVLALSQNVVRFLRGTVERAWTVQIENLPTSLEAMLGYDNLLQKLQFRADPATAGRTAFWYGQAQAEDTAKEQLLHFSRRINDTLLPRLRHEHAPLVLAGVAYLRAIYREVNDYPYLLEEGIDGNPDRLTEHELHERAWELVHPYFARARGVALSRFRDREGTGYTSTFPGEILPAAHEGRVATLFFVPAVEEWGHFDEATHTTTIHSPPEPGDAELLDEAVIQTLLHGGTVYTVEPEQLPAETGMSALFRY
jgi:hypothetical protein